MKNRFLLLVGLALVAGPTNKAHAYSSAVGVDPDKSGIGNGSNYGALGNEVETKAIKKSANAGSSEALVAGLVVAYDTTNQDGYTVTRAVTQTHLGQRLLACVTTDTVATGDTAYHRCITKGLAYVRYNGGTYPIEAGKPACVDAGGTLRGCNITIAEATANTGIVPLKAAGDSGRFLPVLINLR